MGITDLGAYWQVFRPGGVLYGEGQVVMLTDDGELAPWIGGGAGRPTGPGYAAKLARLNGVTTAIEYEVEEDAIAEVTGE